MGDGMIFEVEGEPVPKGRPNFNRSTGVAFTPARTKNREREVFLAAQEAARFFDWKLAKAPTPLKATVTFFLQMPKSWSKKKQQFMFGRYCTKNRDLDNLLKAVWDGMSKAGIFEDDRQIAEVNAAKYWHEEPMTMIRVERI